MGDCNSLWIAVKYNNDAVYAAFALYFVNPVVDSSNLFVWVARWFAPLVMAGSVFLVMKNAVKQL